MKLEELAILALWLSVGVAICIGVLIAALIQAALYSVSVLLFTFWFDEWQFKRRTAIR